MNESKTRMLGPRQRRKITGIVVSDNSVGIGKNEKRKLRARIHALLRMNAADPERGVIIQSLNGWFSHIKAVDPIAYGQMNRYCSKFNVHWDKGPQPFVDE